jgi:hypothetical protein
MPKSEPSGLFADFEKRSEHPDVKQLPQPKPDHFHDATKLIEQPKPDHIVDVNKMVMPPAPHNGTATSRAAALAMDHDWRETQCGKVYAAILAAGEAGKTRQELEDDKMESASVTPRVNDLLKMGLIYEPAGVTRPTKSGRQAQVVRAKP